MTEPGAPGRSGSTTVWIESTASTCGAHGVDVGEHVRQRGLGHDEQAVGERTEPLGPQPHLRARLLGGDEQARGCRRGHAGPSAWSSSVLLPMPGSPASSVTEPATSPPSSTRSSSPIPVGTGADGAGVDLADGHGSVECGRATGLTGPRSTPRDASTSSASVPHASHSGSARANGASRRRTPSTGGRSSLHVFIGGTYAGV